MINLALLSESYSNYQKHFE